MGLRHRVARTGPTLQLFHSGVWGWCGRWPLPVSADQVPLCANSESRNVEEVCRFPELPARKPLTYQAKQLIAHEIEMEKMRRAEALARAGDSRQVSLPGLRARARPRRAGLLEGTLSLEWPCAVSLRHLFLQAEEGPQGVAGEKGMQPPASRSHEEQRLERILKKAALEEQVQGVGVGVGGRRVGMGLVLSPGGLPVVPCCSA